MPDRRTAALAASTVAVLLVLAACSSTAAPGPAGGTTGSTAASTTPSTAPSTAGATPSPGAPATTAPPASPSPSAGGGAVTAVVSGLGTHPVLTPGGAAVGFTVTVHNGTGQALKDIQPLVSMGHCSCSSGGAGLMPAGTLQLRNATTDAWQTIPYDAEGTGTDFAYVDQIPGVALAAGASETFSYRVALVKSTAQGSQPVRNGSSTIDVTVQQLPAHSAFAPAVASPVYVTTAAG